MLTTETLARTIIADRERDLRERHRLASGTASGPRHPRHPHLPDVRHLVDGALDHRPGREAHVARGLPAAG